MLDTIKSKLEKNGIDEMNVRLDIKSSFRVIDLEDSGIDESIEKYFISIQKCTDIELEDYEEVGEIGCSLVRSYDFLDRRGDMRYIADSESDELYFAVHSVTDENSILKAECTNFDILHINYIYINPKHRNKGIGSLALFETLYFFSNKVGAITMMVKPFEADAKKLMDVKNKEYEKLERKIVSFIKQFNFILADKPNFNELIPIQQITALKTEEDYIEDCMSDVWVYYTAYKMFNPLT